MAAIMQELWFMFLLKHLIIWLLVINLINMKFPIAKFSIDTRDP